MKFLKKNKAKIVFFFILAIFALSNLFPVRALYRSFILTTSLISQNEPHLQNFITKKPQVREITYESSGRTIHADLWVPIDNKTNPALILNLGLDIDRKDERIQKIAEALARNGIVVLVPNIPTITSRRLTAETTIDFVNSYKFLKSLDGVKAQKTGFFTFCSAAAVSFLASQSENLENIPVIIAINPYYSISTLYENVVASRSNTSAWVPHYKTVEILNREIIELLENNRDKEILLNNFVKTSQKNLINGTFEKLNETRLNQLTADGQNTYSYLSAASTRGLTDNIAKATPAQIGGLQNLSPATNVENTKAEKVFILTENNFDYIPASEALKLQEDLEKYGKNSTLTELKIDLQDQNSMKNFPELIKLFFFIYSTINYLGN